MGETVFVRFHGDFGPDEGLEFVEVEDEDGASVNVGEWERTEEDIEKGDWKLKLEIEEQ